MGRISTRTAAEKLYRDMTAELIATMPESPVKSGAYTLAPPPGGARGRAAAAPAADDGAG